MDKITKKTLIWSISIFGILIVCYFLYIGYAINSFMTSCGLDDGPFEAKLIGPINISDSAQKFDLAENAILYIENRTDSLSPIITLFQNDELVWTLDTDTSKTEGYEGTELWNISNVNITNTKNPIELDFLSHWTYGYEVGWMEIDLKSGENRFCLSW
ncbi:MAG: hypothetical protein AAFX55_06285 [Bacteroidota bacterium]